MSREDFQDFMAQLTMMNHHSHNSMRVPAPLRDAGEQIKKAQMNKKVLEGGNDTVTINKVKASTLVNIGALYATFININIYIYIYIYIY